VKTVGKRKWTGTEPAFETGALVCGCLFMCSVLSVTGEDQLLACRGGWPLEVDGMLHSAFPIFDNTEDIAPMYLLFVLR